MTRAHRRGLRLLREVLAHRHAARHPTCQGFSDGVPAEFGIAAVDPDPELGDQRISQRFLLDDQEFVEEEFTLAGYCDAECFEAGGERYRFKYSGFFASVDDIFAYASSEKNHIDEKMALFDGVIRDSTVPHEMEQLIAFSLQTYLANSFWMTRHGQDWFSVWEGNCLYHSTVVIDTWALLPGALARAA